jgi:predicted secreted hydrolase
MKSIRLLFLAGVFAVIAIFALQWSSSEDHSMTTALSVASLMGNSNTDGFARADSPQVFNFPQDHGGHADFKTEWWYFTGNLREKNSSSNAPREFGYQLTFFRSALSAGGAPNQYSEEQVSAWKTSHTFMAHFALTDVKSKAFYDFERFSRADNQLAGVTMEPIRVWLEDWQLQSKNDSTLFPASLQARSSSSEKKNIQLSLRLDTEKPHVLQGTMGLSQKGSQKGNASYYYSFSRLLADGTVILNDTEFDVVGTSWMDREWSTSALDSHQVGWDWFALQLSDSTEIMYYQLRKKDGTPDTTSKGVWVLQNGAAQHFSSQSITIEVLDFWESPESGIIYPSAWNLAILPNDSTKISLAIKPKVANQELNAIVRYWEGAVSMEGIVTNTKTNTKKPVTGNGYIEMTGYTSQAL